MIKDKEQYFKRLYLGMRKELFQELNKPTEEQDKDIVEPLKAVLLILDEKLEKRNYEFIRNYFSIQELLDNKINLDIIKNDILNAFNDKHKYHSLSIEDFTSKYNKEDINLAFLELEQEKKIIREKALSRFRDCDFYRAI